MKRREFITTAIAGLGGFAYLALPKILHAVEKKYNTRVLLVNQFGEPITGLPLTAYPQHNDPLTFDTNGRATAALALRGDPDDDGVPFALGDLQLVTNAAEQRHVSHLSASQLSQADVVPDGIITIADAANYFQKLFGLDNQVNHAPLPGEYFVVPVTIAGGNGYLGGTSIPLEVRAGQESKLHLFRHNPLTDPVLAQRYANEADLFRKATNTDLDMIADDAGLLLPKSSKIKRWAEIKVDYRNAGQDYNFANINHSQIMREEAAKLNTLLGYQLFKEDNNNPAVTIDYSTENSKIGVTLYDGNGNPVQGKIWKKKYSGAENWSRAEAQRLLLGLAFGNSIDEHYFHDEHVAVENLDHRVPQDFTNAFKALYKLPGGLDVKVYEAHERKPVIHVDGPAKINTPVRLVVIVPPGAANPTLEYLVAEKETREYWSAESADAQPQHQSSDGNRHIYTFDTEWPGPRRFKATAQRNGQQIETLQDVLVKADKEPEYLRGMNLTGYREDMQNDPDTYFLSTLNRFNEMGINMITLLPEWYLEDHTKTNIHPEYGFDSTKSWRPAKTWTDNLIVKAVNYAKDFGMKVMFRPNIWFTNDPTSWMGMLEPENGDWDALFASHLNYLLHYAELAEQLGVEYLSVGAELNSMTLPNWRGFGVSDPDVRWRHIINEVRNVYNGKLTLSLGSNQYGHEENVANIPFWDALDFIGFEPYFGLTGGNDPINLGKDDPSLQELADGFKYWAEYALLPTLQRFGKKAFITEANYYSFDGHNKNPIGVLGPRSNIPDWKEQADCYNTLIKFFYDKNKLEALNLVPGWIFDDTEVLKFFGSWNQILQGEFPQLLDWVYGKPAERIIQANWKR